MNMLHRLTRLPGEVLQNAVQLGTPVESAVGDDRADAASAGDVLERVASRLPPTSCQSSGASYRSLNPPVH